MPRPLPALQTEVPEAWRGVGTVSEAPQGNVHRAQQRTHWSSIYRREREREREREGERESERERDRERGRTRERGRERERV